MVWKCSPIYSATLRHIPENRVIWPGNQALMSAPRQSKHTECGRETWRFPNQRYVWKRQVSMPTFWDVFHYYNLISSSSQFLLSSQNIRSSICFLTRILYRFVVSIYSNHIPTPSTWETNLTNTRIWPRNTVLWRWRWFKPRILGCGTGYRP
jgi:hypothetical protein